MKKCKSYISIILSSALLLSMAATMTAFAAATLFHNLFSDKNRLSDA